MQEKRVLIEKLEKELEELKSERNSNSSASELSNSSEIKQTINIEVNSGPIKNCNFSFNKFFFKIFDLSQKLKHSKEENKKLKEKIKIQNLEIEEAIQQLIVIVYKSV